MRLFSIGFTAFPVIFEWFIVWKFPFTSTIDILYQLGVKVGYFVILSLNFAKGGKIPGLNKEPKPKPKPSLQLYHLHQPGL